METSVEQGKASKVAKKYVYSFGGGKADGGADLRNLLGGKGANIAEMTGLGIPVPPGFTITTEVCTHFMNNEQTYPDGFAAEVNASIKTLEKAMDARFGDPERPLLVSVRSGSRVSMPGMMDTVLNLGLNDETVQGMARRTGNERFALDSYRRFIQMYGDVVMGVHSERFEALLESARDAAGVAVDNELRAEHLRDLISKYKQIVSQTAGTEFPQGVEGQLWGAIAAVFNSWNSARAISYREMSGYPDHWGTAVNVQAMVFGNMGDDCATGVAFTRDPSTGEKRFFGEYLINAQGEDVVAGIRTPLPISRAENSLEKQMPEIYAELVGVYERLERHYRDMQDIEFTIQSGQLWLLQTRNGKRTGRAAIRIAVEMVEEGLIDSRTALGRVTPAQLEQLLHPAIDPDVDATPFAQGLPASPGAASGKIVFSVDRAVALTDAGENVILVRTETSPEDINGMKVARAILTARGGMTSHAAVVARGMGKCCVAGCTALSIEAAKSRMTVGDHVFAEGEQITVEGSTGKVYAGELPTVDPELDADFERFMTWADECRTMKVRANADTPEDATVARRFGAEGIGLCRTEHMFFGEDRIDVVRSMIVAADTSARVAALRKILPMQREDFVGVFRAMDGLPVTIRLLDPPLHEFLPSESDDIAALAGRLDIDQAVLGRKISELHEFNPMLGHRGCRLGITYPEIYETQARALMEAACAVKKDGVDVRPEIMVPLVGTRAELTMIRRAIEAVATEVITETGVDVSYLIGTMIEVPRAALTAEDVAGDADFFSFGTNDLTQMTYGFSRDDSARFIEAYLRNGILKSDPFETLDPVGVGALVKMACEAGLRANSSLKLGICGEHGGDPESIRFVNDIGIAYVSCSPFRVPIARLAAAQAALE